MSPVACVHPVRAEVARPGRARLSAVPQGMGAAAQRARREGDRCGRVPHQGSARRDRRPHPPQAGSGQHHRSGGSQEPERLSRARRRARRHSRRCRSRTIRTGSRASSAARGATARPSGSKARCSSTSPTATARSRRTRRTGRWTTRSTTTWTSCPRPAILAARLHAEAVGARNASAQKRADELTGGGKRVSIYDMQPQMWTYERTVDGGRTPYRAFVSIPGHLYENFNRPNYRAILLRGIAWAGKRANVDELLQERRARRRPALRRGRTDRIPPKPPRRSRCTRSST